MPQFLYLCSIILIRNHKYFSKGYTLAVMHVGAPAGGMNPATKAFVRDALTKGHSVVAINDGFDGLVKGQVWFTITDLISLQHFSFSCNQGRKAPFHQNTDTRVPPFHQICMQEFLHFIKTNTHVFHYFINTQIQTYLHFIKTWIQGFFILPKHKHNGFLHFVQTHT